MIIWFQLNGIKIRRLNRYKVCVTAAALYDKVVEDYLDSEIEDCLNLNDMSGTRYPAGSISYHFS